jgi:predicted dehydrogenase
MSGKTYRAAVIGLGRMGSTFDDEIKQGGQFFMPYCHAPTYVASPHTELVAGVDPHAEQGAIFAQRWGLESGQIYADYREMLEAEKPDFVSLCTTARHRAAIMIDAINAGVKAIWAEKPFTLSLAEADEVIDLCDRKGVAVVVNCSRRYNVFFTEARRMVEEGELGEIPSADHRLHAVQPFLQRQPCHRHHALSCRRQCGVGLRRDGVGRKGGRR